MKEETIKCISYYDDYTLHLDDLEDIKVIYDSVGYYFYATFKPFYYKYYFDLYYIDRIFGIGTVGKEYRFNGEYAIRRKELKGLLVGEDIIEYVNKEINAMYVIMRDTKNN